MQVGSFRSVLNCEHKINPPVIKKRPNSEGFESTPYEQAGDEASSDERQRGVLYLEHYAALVNAAIRHWMPRLTNAEFKLLMFIIMETAGCGVNSATLRIDELRERLNVHRDSVMVAVQVLQSGPFSLIRVFREHRKTNLYSLNPTAILGYEPTEFGSKKPDPSIALESEKQDSRRSLGSENRCSKTFLESEKRDSNGFLSREIPTQEPLVDYRNSDSKTCLGSEKPDPYKEYIKQQQAAASSFSETEKLEIQKLSERTRGQIDGKEAQQLRAYIERAGLTLSHLRWFLRNEKFTGARSPKAVLFSIAKEFRQRVADVAWPASFDEQEEPLPFEVPLDRI